jgi:hypothetical protein
MVAPRCDWLAAAKIKNTKRATLIITFLEVEEQEAKKKKKNNLSFLFDQIIK